MKKIAIQGTLGSYHDIAAHKYFEGEEIELICCANFEDVFTSIRKDSQVIGMLAIENTIAGSLLHNYELLRESGTTVTPADFLAEGRDDTPPQEREAF